MAVEIRLKNMVCPRCIKVVHDELAGQGYVVDEIELGRVVVSGQAVNMVRIGEGLGQYGFEILTSSDGQKVEEVKIQILNLINSGRLVDKQQPLSDILSKATATSYSTLSNLFSKSEAITIEKYFVLCRIDKAKELLTYGQLNSSQIANQLGFSNVGHLSSQFKQVTGMSPTEFRKAFDVRQGRG